MASCCGQLSSCPANRGGGEVSPKSLLEHCSKKTCWILHNRTPDIVTNHSYTFPLCWRRGYSYYPCSISAGKCTLSPIGVDRPDLCEPLPHARHITPVGQTSSTVFMASPWLSANRQYCEGFVPLLMDLPGHRWGLSGTTLPNDAIYLRLWVCNVFCCSSINEN